MADDNLLIILGNQLFPIEEIKKTGVKKILKPMVLKFFITIWNQKNLIPRI